MLSGGGMLVEVMLVAGSGVLAISTGGVNRGMSILTGALTPPVCTCGSVKCGLL